MAIKEQPVTYTTSDGHEFTKKTEAEAHEALVAAKEKYESTRRTYGLRLAEAQRTADGFLFDFSRRVYYRVACHSWGFPVMAEVSFSGWNCAFDLEGEQFRIIDQTGRDARPRPYDISSLYAQQVNAERALLEAQEKWLAKKQAEVAEARAKLEGDQP